MPIDCVIDPVLCSEEAFCKQDENAKYDQQHLYRLLKHTALFALHWINFNHHKMVFTTVLKEHPHHFVHQKCMNMEV
jgi:hypothetical protein